ncbi:MAG: hypothetical protein J6U01_00655, partial [Clostridia bacterium]|nr:hypothetical protein [Clostridia bacterium]
NRNMLIFIDSSNSEKTYLRCFCCDFGQILRFFGVLRTKENPLKRSNFNGFRVWSIGESNPCSAKNMVATPHSGARFLFFEKAADEIPSTGGHRRLSLSNASHCLRSGQDACATTKIWQSVKPCHFLWSIGESNP